MNIENEFQHYRARFDVYPYSTQDAAFPAVVNIIWEWAQKKEVKRRSSLGSLLSSDEGHKRFVDGELTYPSDYHGGTNTTKMAKLAMDTFSSAGEKSLWALEYDEPDGKLWYRHWHTQIGISYDASDLEAPCSVNVRVSFYTLPKYIGDSPRPPLANVPNFVKEIIGLEGYQSCVGETVALPNEVYLDGNNFDEFQDNLLSPQRELPLILMVTDKNGNTPVWDATELAHNVMGMANVYVADYRDATLRTRMFELFKRDTPSINYRCNPGMLRIYRPGINLSDAYGGRDHRFFPKRTIDDYYRQAREQHTSSTSDDTVMRDGDKLFADVLSKGLARSIIKKSDDVLDLADVQTARNHASMVAMRAKYNALKEQSSKVKQGATAESNEHLLQRIQELQAFAEESFSAYENESDQNKKLTEENNVLQGKTDSMRYRIESAENRAAELTEKVDKLKNEVTVVDNITHIPTSLVDELNLATKLWPTRIFALKEAHESAAEFQGNDLDEYWQILSSEANTLWQLYFEEDSSDVSGEFKSRTGYELAFTEKKLTKRNDALMKQRERTYEGKRIDITPHIKGRDKSPRYAFRLHYYVDEEKQLLVIGHCGGHLTTSGTQKIH